MVWNGIELDTRGGLESQSVITFFLAVNQRIISETNFNV